MNELQSKPTYKLALSSMLEHSKCLQLVADFGLCPQCVVHFLKPQDESIFTGSTDDIIRENHRVLARALHVNQGSDVHASHPTVIKFLQNEQTSPKRLCPCCFGAISNTQLETLADQIVATLKGRDVHSCSADTPVCIEVLTPPIVDAFRITARTVFTRHAEKLFAYPNLDELMVRILSARLKDQLNIVSPAAAKVKISLQASVGYQLEFCEAMWSDFKIKKVKRRFGANNTNTSTASTSASAGISANNSSTDLVAEGETAEAPVEQDNVSRKSIDSLLMQYKSLDAAGFDDLQSRLAAYMSTIPPLATDITDAVTNPTGETGDKYNFRWTVSSTACPVYLLGRYRKLARDVPQSPWTVSVNGKGEDAEDEAPTKAARTESPPTLDTTEATTMDTDPEGGKPASRGVISYARKGRCSVEEIINSVVKEFLQAEEVRMHPCGREDIDVRCLGNGRPFAMEVLDPKIISPSRELLVKIQNIINRGEGLNAAKDVEVALLTQAERSTWETMQTKAEEKRKGYACVVWSEREVTREMLAGLEQRSTSGQDQDETGEASIELNQKTPLRVLHRRSLLDRKRHVYRIETALLNKHFFLMRLVTSAGTYVKEFVHGDMGRTTPSVSSIFQCQADIMQLDVTWLYDDFEGNTGTSSNTSSNPSEVSGADKVESSTGVVVGSEMNSDNVLDGVVYKEGSMATMTWEALRAVNAL